MRTRYLFLPLLLLLSSTLYAQHDRSDRDSRTDHNIPLDYAIFQADDPGMIRVEVYFQIYNFFLVFEEDSGLYRAEYEFHVDLKGDDKSDPAASDEIRRPIIVQDKRRTNSRTDFRTNQFSFVVPPGKYEIRATLRDKNSRSVYKRDLEFKHDGFQKNPVMISSTEFLYAVSPVREKPSPFDKSEMTMIPSVSRIYGGSDDVNRLIYYFEIYSNERAPEEIKLVTLLRSMRRGKMNYRDSITIILDNSVVRQVRDINIDEIEPGDYELEIVLLNKKQKKLDKKRESFTIRMKPEALLRHDYETILKQIAYIAEPGEIEPMEKISEMALRLEAYREFWKRRDPTPGSDINEAKQEFYRRVSYANANYEYMRREGWKTDRGRIYITYGQPDQIDDYPYALNSVPYQEWHYYRDGRYRKFVFVDVNEDGEYKLSYPYDGFNHRPDF
ncbi:MAG: GWxTD domain-containing protein [bacterium]|nr:GWxTD domain-containing protein [bacterium]